MRKKTFPVIAASFGIALAACGSSSTSSSSSGSSGTSASNLPAAPAQITVGTTYSGSGSFATSSLPELAGLKFWIKTENAKGGVYVGGYKKRIPLKLIAYNDLSSATTAATLYNQLLTQDKVNIFVSDFGSVLTAPAVSLAQAHKVVLFDQTGTGIPFFTPQNKYIVLTDLPESSIWPNVLAKFLISKQIKNLAVLYGTNDFDASQATTLKSILSQNGINVAYYQGVPSSTTSYGTLLQTISASKPDAVLEFGYAANDTPFLQNVQSSGMHFKMVFTVFPGQLLSLFQQQVGTAGLAYTYTYGTNFYVNYPTVSEGLNSSQFKTQFAAAFPGQLNSLSLDGYNTGLVIQASLKNAKSLSQTDIRAGAAAASGHLNTLNGNFVINSEGAQTGELLPVAQLFPSSSGITLKAVYPASQATGSAVYPAPVG
ncbi:ABC transporter substrate-binding protein [Acidithrix ferrooxidans]|uniref:Leu/Ile/Val/Thr-binding protein n=1 Tax=Acidithrix ferrooxidans TaxID=1280514 RepID=A0A0D8HFY9_9ACTN|nr:ABC transporter substrate-binding protein [Acidithrix ferrooxidans]KJF16860.1 Leu/Ile/Val/Thr-binding protein precursor [Acidithrix ferrooxidans]